MKTKKILALLASALLLICLVVGGATLAALYSKTNEKQNVFTTANPSVDIEENSSGTPDSSNDIPVENGIAAKQVKIQNTGDISLFVRVMLIPGWKQAGDTAAAGDVNFGNKPFFDPADSTKLVMGDVTLQLAANWETYWFYDESANYFYHRTDVPAGDSTALLLEAVKPTEGTDVSEEFWDALQVEVITDTIQSEGNAAADAWGKTARDLPNGRRELQE